MDMDSDIYDPDLEADDVQRFDELVEQMKEDIEQRLYEICFNLDDYTINISSQLKLTDVITTEYGDYSYELIIKRI
jgi:hypothetical protein